MNIPAELEGPTTVCAENVSLLVYSSKNMVKSLDNAITKDVFCNVDKFLLSTLPKKIIREPIESSVSCDADRNNIKLANHLTK